MIKNKEKGSGLVYAAAISAMIFWGGSYVWSTIVFKYWDPITTIFMRLVFCSAILFLVLKLFNRLDKIERKDYKNIFVLALFNPFLYFLGESFGLKYSSPTVSATFIAMIPIFTTLVASFTLKERLLPINILGMVVSFAGLILMIINKEMELTAKWYGIVCLLFAVASSVIYSVFIRKMSIKYNAFTIIAWQDLGGVLLFLPLFLIFGWKNFITTEPTTELISSFLMLMIFASMLAFPFYTYSISKLGVSRAAIFANLIPVVTAIISFALGYEDIYINKIIGIVLVTGGVFLSQVGKTTLSNTKANQ